MKKQFLKRTAAFFLAAVTACSLFACGSPESSGQQGDGQQASDTQQPAEQPAAKDSLEILTVVWDSYGEDEKFAVAGGDMSEENMNAEGPGRYSLEDPQALDTSLGFPADLVDKIDDAASLMHMMNANTFTCGVYHVKDGGDVSAVAAAIKDNIMQRQWMCGFPDKLVIASVGEYVAAFFGETEIMDTFRTKLTGAYPSAEIITEAPIA